MHERLAKDSCLRRSRGGEWAAYTKRTNARTFRIWPNNAVFVYGTAYEATDH